MKIINTKTGGAAIALGLLLSTVNCPSYAWGCFNYQLPSVGYQLPNNGEVLQRDAYLNGEIKHDFGRLDGRFGKLEREDHAIKRQALRDERMNGGYLTPQEQWQLNGEENALQGQINRDYRPFFRF